MSQVAKCFALPESRFERFAKAMDKLVRRAKRLDSGQIAWTKIGEHMNGRNDQPAVEGQPRFKYIDIQLMGDAPVLKDWRFVAKLEHLHEVPEGQPNIIIHNPTGESLPNCYHSASHLNCDQCHRAVARHDTFIVRHEKLGTYRQVGRQCLRDFLGHNSPEHTAMYFQIYSAFMGATDEWSNDDIGDDNAERGYGLRRYHYWDLEWTLAVTLAVIREHGWCSRRMARENPNLVATADRVSDFVCDSVTSRARRGYTITEADSARATEIVEWFQFPNALPLAARSDYEFNLKTLAEIGSIRGGHFGLAVSMVPYWERMTQRTQDWRSRSVHIGTIGERLNINNVEIYSIKIYDGGYYGPTKYIRMRHGDNDLLWRTGAGAGFQEGAIVTVRATIKRHNVFRNTKETELSRCTLIVNEEEVNA